MKEISKRKLLVMITLPVGIYLLCFLNNFRYIATHAHATTWAGKPAVGMVTLGGDYSFYDMHGNIIATFPAGEAAKLH